jgi:hypothetical protein
MPVYAFCGDELVGAYLSPCKSDANKHSRALLKLLVRRLRESWPDVKIAIRIESDFAAGNSCRGATQQDRVRSPRPWPGAPRRERKHAGPDHGSGRAREARFDRDTRLDRNFYSRRSHVRQQEIDIHDEPAD